MRGFVDATRLWVCGGISLCLSAITVQEQFRTGIDLIRLDVTVLDHDRRPVPGLTAADFTIQEDGRLQKIAAFAEISLPDPETFSADWMREVSPDVRLNDDTSDYRLLVLVRSARPGRRMRTSTASILKASRLPRTAPATNAHFRCAP